MTTLTTIAEVAAQGPFQPHWDSLTGYRVPDWYTDGKFGIFIHWGPYCVPAFGNEWYPRNMYLPDQPEFAHHLATYGPHAQFGYKDFLPQFTAAHFDADAWAELFHAAGARFVVPVAEHHDGFAMYDCSFSDWCAARMGPRRDIVGELGNAVRQRGMVLGVSSHRAEHWWFFNGGMQFDSDVRDPRYAGLYGPAEPKETQPNQAFLDDWLLRTCELIDKYQPQLIWFDWWIEEPAFAAYLQRFAAYCYNRAAEWGKGVAINHKFTSFPPGTAVFDIERGQLAGIAPFFWQNDTSVAKNSWGYTSNQQYKTVDSLVDDLADIVSKNGALLLNIGPRADGTIPEPEQAMLREIGAWLRVNGDAIYNTRPWAIFGEGPTEVVEGSFTDTQRSAFTGQDIRFTTHDNQLYAICLDWPGTAAHISSLATGRGVGADAITEVRLLGVDAPLTWQRDENGLHVQMPAARPCDHAYTLKITLNDGR